MSSCIHEPLIVACVASLYLGHATALFSTITKKYTHCKKNQTHAVQKKIRLKGLQNVRKKKRKNYL